MEVRKWKKEEDRDTGESCFMSFSFFTMFRR